MLALVDDARVDLVGQDDQVVRHGDGRDALDVRRASSTAPVGFWGLLKMSRRVRGVMSERSSSRSSAEAVLGAQRDGHRRGAHEAGHRFVDGEARVGHDDLVTGPDEGHQGEGHDRLGAGRDDDPVRARPGTPRRAVKSAATASRKTGTPGGGA